MHVRLQFDGLLSDKRPTLVIINTGIAENWWYTFTEKTREEIIKQNRLILEKTNNITIRKTELLINNYNPYRTFKVTGT